MVGRSWHNKNSWKHPLKLCLFIGAFTCTHHKKAAHRLYFSGICLPLQLYEQIQRYSVRILHSVFLLYLHPPSISLRKSNKELTQATAFESCCPLTAAQGPLWQGHYLWKKPSSLWAGDLCTIQPESWRAGCWLSPQGTEETNEQRLCSHTWKWQLHTGGLGTPCAFPLCKRLICKNNNKRRLRRVAGKPGLSYVWHSLCKRKKGKNPLFFAWEG